MRTVSAWRRAGAVTVALVALGALLLPASAAQAARSGPTRWSAFKVGVGGEIPVTGAVAGRMTPAIQTRLHFERIFVIIDAGWAVTFVEERANEDIDAGQEFSFGGKAGYNFGSPTTHIGVGGGIVLNGFGQPNQDVGIVVNLIMGAFPEAYLTDAFALTGFLGVGFEIYTEDAIDGQHSAFRMNIGSANAAFGMGMMYYF